MVIAGQVRRGRGNYYFIEPFVDVISTKSVQLILSSYDNQVPLRTTLQF